MKKKLLLLMVLGQVVAPKLSLTGPGGTETYADQILFDLYAVDVQDLIESRGGMVAVLQELRYLHGLAPEDRFFAGVLELSENDQASLFSGVSEAILTVIKAIRSSNCAYPFPLDYPLRDYTHRNYISDSPPKHSCLVEIPGLCILSLDLRYPLLSRISLSDEEFLRIGVRYFYRYNRCKPEEFGPPMRMCGGSDVEYTLQHIKETDRPAYHK